MNANELMYWLKDHFDLSNEQPSKDNWARIKGEVMNAYSVDAVIVDSPPMHASARRAPPTGGCTGCK